MVGKNDSFETHVQIIKKWDEKSTCWDVFLNKELKVMRQKAIWLFSILGKRDSNCKDPGVATRLEQ